MTAPFPQSVDSERGVLAAVLLSPDAVLDLCASKGVTAETFYLPAHVELYETFLTLREQRKPIEFIILAQHLRDTGELEAIGGPPYLHELSNLLPSAAYASHHVADILEKQVARRIIAVATKAAARAHNGDVPAEVLEEMERDTLGIRNNPNEDQERSIRDVVPVAIERLSRQFDNPGQISGMSWGFKTIDDATDGLVPGEFIILAGLPAVGKTSLVRQTGAHVANTAGPVGVWNMEMSDEQLARAWIFQIAEVNAMDLRRRAPTDGERFRLVEAAATLAKLPITLMGRPGMTVQAFQASVRRLVRKKGIVLAIVDSATQMTSEGSGRKRWEDVVDIAPGYKSAAKENNIPVCVLWHLGAKFEERLVKEPNGIPKGNELEGGQAGWRNADKFCSIVERDQHHEFCSSKDRMGELARVPITFDKRFTRFREIEKEPEQGGLGI